MSSEPPMTSEDDRGYPVGPVWDPKTRRLAAIVTVVVVVVVGIFLFFGILDSIIIAALLAFLIEPIIRWAVDRLHAPRWLALTIIYLIVAAVAFGAVLFLPVMVIGSIAQIDFAEIAADIDAWFDRLMTQLSTQTFLGIDLSGLATVGDGAEEGGSMFEPGTLLAALGDTLAAAAGVLGVFVGIISAIFFILIIAVYLSTGAAHKMLGVLPGLVPDRSKVEIMELGRRLNGVWNDYVRGQGIMVLVIGFTTFIVTWLLGLPGALFLGVIAGLLEVIPTFGPIIATIPAVLIALFQGSTRFDMPNLLFALIVIVAYILIQQLESNIIAPKVMGASVRIPALVVLISITAGYQVAGILGAILAVPVVASVRIVLSYLWRKVQARDPWAPNDLEDAQGP